MVPLLLNEPTLIEYKNLKFLILDAPNDANISFYEKKMVSYGITDLVRTNPCSYDTSGILKSNILIHDLYFDDGSSPPVAIIFQWMDIVKACILNKGAIAVHCVAGLGRAPVLVGIALIEYGMERTNAINFIRERRKGALNRNQLQFLMNYKSPYNKKFSCFKICTIF